jgi:DNA repair protein SbcD/Mre11
MPRFLHLADIHLGFDKYDSPQRTLDFFRAFQDALVRYAIQPQVDFVLIAGDLFEHRHILPVTLNHAQICLEMLREAEIPVLAIEGNHDYRPYGSRTSWLRYLAGWELLMLLEPDDHDQLEPWNPDEKVGGYVDLDCGVRVIGSRWYGAAAPQAILKLANTIEQLPPGPEHTVMMFHHGLEGQVARYTGALRYQDLLPLREAGVDYLALGHIHRHYSAEGWIFNPGSTEANSVIENQTQNPRGVYSVTLSPEGISTTLQQDYYQRPIVRLGLTVDSRHPAAEVEAAAIELIKQKFPPQKQAGKQQSGNHPQPDKAAPIVELRLQGQVSFNRLDLDVRTLRDKLQALSGALIFLLRYDVTSTAYDTAIPGAEEEVPPRQEIEQYVFTDLLAAYAQYRDQAPQLARGLMELKEQLLSGHSAEVDLYNRVEQLLAQAALQPAAGQPLAHQELAPQQSTSQVSQLTEPAPSHV